MSEPKGDASQICSKVIGFKIELVSYVVPEECYSPEGYADEAIEIVKKRLNHALIGHENMFGIQSIKAYECVPLLVKCSWSTKALKKWEGDRQ